MKIFGIGLSKTGTSSLAQALEMLGYRTRDYPGLSQYVPGDLATFKPGMLDGHDALTDTPVPSFYRELDDRYPGAKFVLTVRDMDGWLKSCKKQFTEKHAANLTPAHHQLFVDLYGTPVFEEERFRQGYERFTSGVLEYFRDRPSDLLVLNVSNGEGWEKLCPFLGRTRPEVPFPKANVTRIRWTRIEDVIDIAREAAALAPQLPAEASRRSPGQLVRVRAAIDRWVGTLQAGAAGSVEGTRKAIDRHVRERLAVLTPDVPVLSAFSPAGALAEKSRLNHFWMVEPLECAAAASAPSPTSAISLALIEDQKPIYGVVCLPASDTVYYAVMGKGAFRIEGDGPRVKLEGRSSGAPAASAQVGTAGDGVMGAGSLAWLLCRVASGAAPADVELRDAHDWQVAASDAILRGVGLQIRSAVPSERFSYGQARSLYACLQLGPAG
jgi:fructose-1,6-bisphosphatase/inositol monophosphatase family enzyme